jgi:hypothetical protein
MNASIAIGAQRHIAIPTCRLHPKNIHHHIRFPKTKGSLKNIIPSLLLQTIILNGKMTKWV